MESVFKSLA